MAYKTIAAVCRVGHLLAKPGHMVKHSKPNPLLMMECSRCHIRYQSRDDCKQKPVEKCGERFKDAPCDQNAKKPKTHIKQAMPQPLPLSEQEIKLKTPDICCGNVCPDAVPRLDTLYYKRSDKAQRKYEQTWAECPELMKKPKLLCRYESIIYPKLEKRPRGERPQTACKPPECNNTKTACPRFNMPRCGKARRPPKCSVTREPLDCMKDKAPYPSFSECKRDLPHPLHPIECKCLALPTMCEVWEHFHKVQANKAGVLK
uniref:Uncharacterized protein n=1 Tax=Stomoxys calcitrans TaxID=35570 RepID=A0A1I8P989_STOCA